MPDHPQDTIESNARLEFECIWREHERTGKSRIEIADTLSLTITTMRMQLMQSKVCSPPLVMVAIHPYAARASSPACDFAPARTRISATILR